MKIAILETAHFQYALTQAEIFREADICIITTEEAKREMLDYSPDTSRFEFFIIEKISKNETDIVNFIQDQKIDLFLISPVFDSYAALKRIVKKVKNCKKVITTHNINTWFNGRFWSPRSFMDRANMRSILRNCDYIAVEDFIYNHLKSTNDVLFREYKFIYIPFTIFHENKPRKYQREDTRLKVVLPGHIDGDRRRYEEVLDVMRNFIERKAEIKFSFAGRAKGDYGKKIQNQLREIKKEHPEFVSFFEDDSTADMFRCEMETSDIVLSTSTKTFNGMGTTEYIGKTKPTAAIHDMMSYELPGLLPAHLKVPENLIGSAFNYSDTEDLIRIFQDLLAKPSMINQWKEKAKLNSLNFTAKEIRKGLPF